MPVICCVRKIGVYAGSETAGAVMLYTSLYDLVITMDNQIHNNFTKKDLYHLIVFIYHTQVMYCHNYTSICIQKTNWPHIPYIFLHSSQYFRNPIARLRRELLYSWIFSEMKWHSTLVNCLYI